MKRFSSHPYLANSEQDIQEMLKSLNISSIEELFSDIPDEIKFKGTLKIPHYNSEFEVYQNILSLLEKNQTTRELKSFLGGGVLDIYIPASQDELLRRSEFYTSYTPYQPEITQGMLQGLFEYQSMVCELTGMNTANSSMYDWATAAAEAILMSNRITRRSKVLYTGSIAPNRLAVIKTYTSALNINLVEIPYDAETGKMDVQKAIDLIDDETACVYFENPNYFGVIEDQIEAVIQKVHEHKGVAIAGVDFSSLALIEAPGNYGADIAVGEGQVIGGSPLSFGGPLVGVFAMKFDRKWTRQMPGRIVGLTKTIDGKERAFVNTLQTREQHIKRERATSNICSNQALNALSVAIHLALLGPQGLKEIAESMYFNAHYLVKELEKVGIKRVFTGEFFNTFVAELKIPKSEIEDFNQFALTHKILPGIVHSFKDEHYDLIITTSYLLQKADLDALVEMINLWRRK
ncbi:MAG: aminomethyl-transferring glycine dehydrogenase subunit GcvPA [Candidatus Heimdallarchaeaceae archaeon]